MPVYGKKILGEAEFVEQARHEQATASVYGKRVAMRTPGPLAVETTEPVPFIPAASAEPVASLEPVVETVTPDAAQAALLRMEGVLGEGYAVGDAVQALATAPEFWTDLALAELARAETMGARKGIHKLLAETEVAGTDRTLLDAIAATFV